MNIKIVNKEIAYRFPQEHLSTYSQLTTAIGELFGKTHKLEQNLHCFIDSKTFFITNDQTYKQALSKQTAELQLFVSYDVELRGGIDKQETSVEDVIVKYKLKGTVKKDSNWDEDQWLDYIIGNIEKGKQEQVRKTVKLKSKVQKKKGITFQANFLKDDVLKEIKTSNTKERVSHSEDGAGSFLLSFMSSKEPQLAQGKSKQDEACRKLLQLQSWRQKKKLQKVSKSINGLTLQTKQQTVLPFLFGGTTSKIQNKDKDISYLFTDDNSCNKIAYFLLDKMYHTVVNLSQNQIDQDQVKNLIGVFRQYSDNDYNFVIKVIEAYATYAMDGNVYRSPVDDRSGILPQFEDNEVVGILGDWGTGFKDAEDLLDQLVFKENATVILHLGDVYYSGFPEQFQRISNKLNQIQKKRPRVRYYTVPGNHDYYTFGGPFFQHLKHNHINPQLNQQFSFFCLRNKSHTIQYIGIDTGRNQHQFTTPFNPFFDGPSLQQAELNWVKSRVKQFQGRTILLSHHPLFSAFETIVGKLTDFGGRDQQISYRLGEQLFQIFPKLTCWMWGHEHRFAVYKQNSYGLSKSILLGNSSFQNNEEDYYKQLFNQGDLLRPQYTPGRDSNGYIHHTAAVMSGFNNYQISLKYIYMTSSYSQSSVKIREQFDKVSQSMHPTVQLNTPYHLLQQSGLSLSAQEGCVWLHYVPSIVQFKLVEESECNGDLLQNVDVLIQVENSQYYLYYSSWGYVQMGDYFKESELQKFKYFWRVGVNSNKQVQIGDNLDLVNVYRKAAMGRQVHSNYFRLSASDADTFPSKFQIYRKRIDPVTVDSPGTVPMKEGILSCNKCYECCNIM